MSRRQTIGKGEVRKIRTGEPVPERSERTKTTVVRAIDGTRPVRGKRPRSPARRQALRRHHELDRELDARLADEAA